MTLPDDLQDDPYIVGFNDGWDKAKAALDDADEALDDVQTQVICPHCGRHVMWIRMPKDPPASAALEAKP